MAAAEEATGANEVRPSHVLRIANATAATMPRQVGGYVARARRAGDGEIEGLKVSLHEFVEHTGRKDPSHATSFDDERCSRFQRRPRDVSRRTRAQERERAAPRLSVPSHAIRRARLLYWTVHYHAYENRRVSGLSRPVESTSKVMAPG